VVARHADGAMLVVRHGRTKRNQVEQSMNDLNVVGARLLGSVLNMQPARGVDKSSYYDSGYYTTEEVVAAAARPAIGRLRSTTEVAVSRARAKVSAGR
jgi:Mrp family chromosome partitioning ATPase